MALTAQQLERLKEIQQRRTTQAATPAPTAPTAPVAPATAPTATTAPSTAPEKRGFLDRVKDFAGGALYGVSAPGRTIQNQVFNRIGGMFGIEGKATKEGFEQATGADVDTTSGKVGNFVGQTIPFAVGGSGAAALTKGGSLLARSAAQGATSFGIQSMNEGEINQSSVVAGVVDAAFPVAGRALKLGGDVLKGLAGGVSGAGVDVIEAALARPGAAFKAAGKGSPADLKALSETIRAGAKQLYKKAGTEYAETVSKAGITQLPRDEVVTSVANKFVDVADAQLVDDGVKFVDTPFTDVEEKQLQKVFNTVKNWSDWTPEGLNTLATKVSRFRRGAQDSANFDRVVDTVRRDLRDYVGSRFPEIADANRVFSERMDLLDEIDNVLKTNPNLGTREGVRKTAEALGRIFNANKEFSREAVEALEKELGVDIIGTMAGQQLSQTAPRSSARIGDLIMNLVQPLGSVAARNAVPLAGAIKLQVVDRILAVPGVEPSARAAIVQAVSELFAEPDDSVPDATEKKGGAD